MTKTVNLKRGDRFGKLHVIERVKSDRHGKAHYLCYCTCGRQTTVSRSRLITGKTKSCGCLKSQTKHGDARRGKHSQLYDIWVNLPQRCRTENSSRIGRCFERKVSVFRYWEKYTTFKKWAMSNGYEPGLFLVKINKNGNYTPQVYNSFSKSRPHNNLNKRPSQKCEKACEQAHLITDNKALQEALSDKASHDMRLLLIIQNWDMIPEEIRQSVFLQLAQFSFDQWRENS